VARVRSGDERCFEEIYDRYHRQLLAFCRHMLGTREEAEDALQQVFISAHGQLLRDDRAIQLKPWLYAIARNRCLSTLRDRRATVDLDTVAEPSTDGLAIATEVERRQDLKDILGDVQALPDDERAALVLAELGDLSHDEIAVALGVRTERVKALVFQARKSLLGAREARGADCTEIQAQLATLRGGSLRRSSLRRHVAVCSACTAFEAEVSRQRAALGLILPVIPSVALKHGILTSILASGTGAAATGAVGAGGAAGGAAIAGHGAGAGMTGAMGVSGVASGVAVKVAVAVMISGGALGAGVAVQRADGPTRTAPPAERRVQPVAPAVAPASITPAERNAVTALDRSVAGRPGRSAKARPAPASSATGGRHAKRSQGPAGARGRSPAASRKGQGAAGGRSAGHPGSVGTRPAHPAVPSRPTVGSRGGNVTGSSTPSPGLVSPQRVGQDGPAGARRRRAPSSRGSATTVRIPKSAGG